MIMGCSFKNTPHDFMRNSSEFSQSLLEDAKQLSDTEEVTTEVVEPKGEKKEKEKSWELIWHDEFDGDALDLSKWSYQTGNSYNGWGNYEAQYYMENNVSVKDGMLIIEARKENIAGCNYSSGRIRTLTEDGQVLFGTQCGKVEARISMPIVDGLWPAFWMMPIENAYGLWPLSGEIDIMEARGRIPNTISGTLHFGESAPNNKRMTGDYYFGSSNISEFHVYGVEWDTNEIKWLVDDKVYYQTSNWYTVGTGGEVCDYPAPFDKPFYLLLNLAVGGTYDNGILPKENELPAQMKVDYVRVYKSQDGYASVSVEKKQSEMDVKTFQRYKGKLNYITDQEFLTMNMQPFTGIPMYERNQWYFLTENYFYGSAMGELVEYEGEKYFRCNIWNAGTERYAIQLQHKIPLVKGYTYVVEFEAKADAPRTISLNPIGMKNGEAVSYSDSSYFWLEEKMNKYYCSFTMKEESDVEGIIGFNLGMEAPNVTIGRVSVRVLDEN